MRSRPARTALAAVALLAAACNDDGAGAGAAGTTTGAGAPAPAGPDARLRRLVLLAEDFPPGWTSEPAAPEDDGAAGEDLEACLGIAVDDDTRPQAESDEFSEGPLTQASSSVSLAPDRAAVDAEFAALQGSGFADCARREFDEVAAEDPEVGFAPSRAGPLDFADLGEGTVATRLTTSVTAEGQEIPIFADLVFVRRGLAELSFSFVNAGQPFPADLATQLVGKVLARA